MTTEIENCGRRFDQLVETYASALGVEVEITEADRLRGAIAEALYWLDENAPAPAREVLAQTLKIK